MLKTLGVSRRIQNILYGEIKRLERENAPKIWTGYYGIYSPGDHRFIRGIQEETPIQALLKLHEKSGYYDPYTRAKVKRITSRFENNFRKLKVKEIDIEKYNEERKQMRAERHERLYGGG